MTKEPCPPMHTAEHILNQTMVRMFGTDRCFSAHIERKKSKCDYYFTRALTQNELNKLEACVNQIINKGLIVKEEFIPYESALTSYDLRRLPEMPALVRVIKIGDYDACPCAGQHVRNTMEIGRLKIISSNYSDKVLRIRYKLGSVKQSVND